MGKTARSAASSAANTALDEARSVAAEALETGDPNAAASVVDDAIAAYVEKAEGAFDAVKQGLESLTSDNPLDGDLGQVSALVQPEWHATSCPLSFARRWPPTWLANSSPPLPARGQIE